MSRKPNSKLNENGFASIVIALIFIIVLALLTVGFAQLARREQQTALDKQLSTQANYAAESGINAAYTDIKSGAIYDNTSSGGTTDASSTTCMTPVGASSGTKTLPTTGPTPALTANQTIDANDGVTYTCLLVALQTPNLTLGNNPPSTGKHMNFSTQDPLTSLTIYWGSDSGHNTNFPSYATTKLPALNNWSSSQYPPVVELSITPVSSLSTQSSPTQYLIANTTNVFLYPDSSSSNDSCSTTGATPCAQGQVLLGGCNTTASRAAGVVDAANYPCSATLTGLGSQAYVVHEVDFYDTSNIWIDGTVNAGGTPTPAQFTGEPMIDVTGKARNVLKRLQARLFINGGTSGSPDDNDILPNGAIEAQNVCKRIQAAPSTTDFPAGSTYDTGTSSTCDLSQ